jgi:hypothetical protein
VTTIITSWSVAGIVGIPFAIGLTIAVQKAAAPY